MGKSDDVSMQSTGSKSRGAKQETKAAFKQLMESVQDLIRAHCRFTDKYAKVIPQGQLDIKNQDSYAYHINKIIDAIEPLANLVNSKHPGGPKKRIDIIVSHQILKDHYIKTGKILSAPALIKEYNLQVYNERFHIDENGNETVSEKMARKEISTFKEGLKHVNFYRN